MSVELILQPALGKVLVQKSGVFSVHREDAALECNCPALRGPCGGLEVGKMPLAFRAFELLCLSNGNRFIKLMARRGFEWHGGNLMLHGPWPSKVQNMTDPTTPLWSTVARRDPKDDEEHPERFLYAVSDTENHVFMDYMVVGDFLFKDKFTDLEITSGTS